MDFTQIFVLEHLQSFDVLDVAPNVLIGTQGLQLKSGELSFFVKESKIEEVIFKTLHQAGFKRLRYEDMHPANRNLYMTPEEAFVLLIHELKTYFKQLSPKQYAHILVSSERIWFVFNDLHFTLTI